MGRHFSDPMGSGCPRNSGVASTPWQPDLVECYRIYAGSQEQIMGGRINRPALCLKDLVGECLGLVVPGLLPPVTHSGSGELRP